MCTWKRSPGTVGRSALRSGGLTCWVFMLSTELPSASPGLPPVALWPPLGLHSLNLVLTLNRSLGVWRKLFWSRFCIEYIEVLLKVHIWWNFKFSYHSCCIPLWAFPSSGVTQMGHVTETVYLPLVCLRDSAAAFSWQCILIVGSGLSSWNYTNYSLPFLLPKTPLFFICLCRLWHFLCIKKQ